MGKNLVTELLIVDLFVQRSRIAFRGLGCNVLCDKGVCKKR